MRHATIYHYTPGVRDYVKSPPVNELSLSKQERIRTSALRFLLQPDLLAELLFGNTLWPIRFEIAFNSTVSIKHCQCHDYCKKRKKDNQPPRVLQGLIWQGLRHWMHLRWSRWKYSTHGRWSCVKVQVGDWHFSMWEAVIPWWCWWSSLIRCDSEHMQRSCR